MPGPASPRSPRSPRALGGGAAAFLTEYDADGRAAARLRLADALAPAGGAGRAGAAAGTGGARGARGTRGALAAAFLPGGYPGSVTPDYPEFITWHAAQGLSSYIRGVLSTHAVLRGAATALGAVFQFFIRDVFGMAGGIVFATHGDFTAYAKQWRLFADVANDVAMAIDLASPLVPALFLPLACLASLARAMVGTAAGATHAALTQHFGGGRGGAAAAAADLTAKADSRERAVSITGSILGMALAHALADNAAAAWLIFAALSALHVWANVRAMRCLVLTTLNVPRLELLLGAFLGTGRAPAPAAVGAEESLLAPPFRALADAALRRRGRRVVFGARPAEVLRCAAASAAAAGGGGAGGGGAAAAARLLSSQAAAAAGEYCVALDGRGRVLVAVAHGADARARLKAYVHALYLARHAGGGGGGGGGGGETAAAAAEAAPGGARGRRRRAPAAGGGGDEAGGGGGGGAAGAKGGGPHAALLAEAERWVHGPRGFDALLAEAARAGWDGPERASLPRPAWTGKWV
ncbi:hypothetical protein Rsub_05892 [Raphidocelis subcapitata]|uniref:Protein root UVB sensitive/RUS domain-containing protein n=1 Tax=Raphidocelis subcapitata TaxID=307507 RepID=A0A2V0NZU8_9CHLO|nr:hypothetical protein Rsub_05892 [Raphidocelis subcapitata]|eukprot:GBF93161.1 hypothetical protein Rsub_05892 [Raphidocelis subcapitata]